MNTRIRAGWLVLYVLLCTTMGCTRSDADAAENGTMNDTQAVEQLTPVTPSGSLDGKGYVVRLSEHGKPAPEEDQLIFKDGMFRSVGCDQYGFLETPYTTAMSGGAVTFEATSTSEKEGTMVWTGTVNENTILGEVVWAKDGQEPITYTFAGTMQ